MWAYPTTEERDEVEGGSSLGANTVEPQGGKAILFGKRAPQLKHLGQEAVS